LTREGVRGLELNRMSEGPVTPSHNAALPFTRFVVGPADYTPLTLQPSRLGQTTISHQLATLICFDSPLQTIAEHPESILAWHDARVRKLIEAIPAVWEETLVLPMSRIGSLAVMARRCGDDWFVAGINGGPATDCEIDLDFLPPGTRHALLVTDHSKGSYLVDVETKVISSEAKTSLALNQGGGFVLWLPPIKATEP
jgi:alpha-glucosidase